MSKPVKPAVMIVAAVAIALSVLLVAFAAREKRSVPAPSETQEPIVAASPTPPAPSEPTAKSPPPLPAALATAPRLRLAKKSDAEKPLEETALMSKLHDLAASDPPLSLRLAKEALDRFPDSPNAPEFNWNVVKALFNMGRLEEAREEARVMVTKYPGNHFAADVDHHLLNHPPNPTDVSNP